MKKTVNADIKNLFQKFGGDTGSYKEIQQDYVTEKAQQNWPIVNAIEKAQAAAPRLRASAPSSRTPQPAPSQPIQSRVVASQPMPNPAPHASSLFGSLAARAEPLPAAPAPLSALFGGLNKAVHAAPDQAIPVQVVRSEKDTLNTVFSRLQAPQEVASAPEKNLRGLFGFLSK